MNHISPQGSTEMRACVCKPGYKAAADNSCDRVNQAYVMSTAFFSVLGNFTTMTKGATNIGELVCYMVHQL